MKPKVLIFIKESIKTFLFWIIGTFFFGRIVQWHHMISISFFLMKHKGVHHTSLVLLGKLSKKKYYTNAKNVLKYTLYQR